MTFRFSFSLDPKEGAIFGKKNEEEFQNSNLAPGCLPIPYVTAPSFFPDCVQAPLQFPPDSPRPVWLNFKFIFYWTF